MENVSCEVVSAFWGENRRSDVLHCGDIKGDLTKLSNFPTSKSKNNKQDNNFISCSTTTTVFDRASQPTSSQYRHHDHPLKFI